MIYCSKKTIKDVLWQLCVMYKKTSCKKRSFYTFFKVFIIIISVVKRCYPVLAFKRMMEMLGIIKTEAARDFGYWVGAVYQHMTCIFKTHIIQIFRVRLTYLPEALMRVKNYDWKMYR